MTTKIEERKWEMPIPLDTIILPEFPVSALPREVSAYVKAVATFTQTPPEMAGLLSLGVLATAFQGRYVIEAK